MDSKTRKILIAMDGSDHSLQTYNYYLKNIRHPEDEVLIAWNVDPHPASYGTVNLMTGDPDIINKVLNEHVIHIKHTVKNLENLLANDQLQGRVLQLHNARAGEGIIKAATDENVDMIIVGSRGLGTIRRTILGSVSDYVLHHAHIPVFICKFEHSSHK
ncbi:hypothetical protein ACF0H5_011786 [Mactra antiquata]